MINMIGGGLYYLKNEEKLGILTIVGDNDQIYFYDFFLKSYTSFIYCFKSCSSLLLISHGWLSNSSTLALCFGSFSKLY
jgi:hypothetical protein